MSSCAGTKRHLLVSYAQRVRVHLYLLVQGPSRSNLPMQPCHPARCSSCAWWTQTLTPKVRVCNGKTRRVSDQCSRRSHAHTCAAGVQLKPTWVAGLPPESALFFTFLTSEGINALISAAWQNK